MRGTRHSLATPRAAYTPANGLMAEALENARTSDSFVSRSFPLPHTKAAPQAVVHLVPVRGSARDIFLNAAFFMVVTPVDRSRVHTAETIQGLFDLTPAEARVARLLAA